jgi:hypothetical protein
VIKNEVLQIIRERFPDLAEQIESLFSGCEGFQEICEDYVLCQNAVQKIESGDPLKKGEYLKEYEKALAELEEELLTMVKNDKISKIPE